MKYPLVIFDFDGTLADSFPFFLGTQRTLAERHGFRAINEERMGALRRLGTRELMRELKCPAWKVPIVAADFIRAMHDAPPVPLFSGMSQVLLQLRDRGSRLSILTSNSIGNVRRVLGAELADAIELFDGGAHILGKHRRLARLLARTRIDKAQAIYVGDQLSDGEAARRAGIAFGAVAWGYADPETLRLARPDEFFESVSDLCRLADVSANGSAWRHTS